MNSYALLSGIGLGLLIITRFNQQRYQQKPRFYPLLLATFPLYYWLFAVWTGNLQVLIQEVVAGSIFLLFVAVVMRASETKQLLLLSFGFIAHGVYDMLHHRIHAQTAAPVWWPEFCGVIDVIIGLYVFKLAYQQDTNDQS